MRGNRLFRLLDRYIGIPLCFILGIFAKIHRSSLPNRPSSILIIKLSAMGDTILLIPSLRLLREEYPKSYITIVVTTINKEVVEGCPYVDETICLDIGSCSKNPIRFIRLISILQKKKIDLVLDFDQWLRLSPLISYFSGGKERIGFRTEGQYRHYLYTVAVTHRRDKHEVECFIEIIKRLGIEVQDYTLEIWLEDDEGFIKDLQKKNEIREEDLVIAIHPGCPPHGWQREWGVENYAQLADRLIARYQCKIVLTGSQGEIETVKRMEKLMKYRPIVLAGRVSLKQLATLLKRCQLLICGNTGVMHLAAACHTSTIGLHGPTDPKRWGCWGGEHIVIQSRLPCTPCLYLGFEYGCKNPHCMDTITVEEVVSAVDSILSKERRDPWKKG